MVFKFFFFFCGTFHFIFKLGGRRGLVGLFVMYISLTAPRVDGSNPGLSIFFRSSDCYDATLAATKWFNYEAERRSKTLGA